MNSRDFDRVAGAVWDHLLRVMRREVCSDPEGQIFATIDVSGGRMVVDMEVESSDGAGFRRRLSAPVVLDRDLGGGLLDSDLLDLPGLTEVERNAFVLLTDSKLTRSQVDVRTVGQLVGLGRDDLLRMRGVAEGTVRVIEQVLARHGLWLGARLSVGGVG